jgi:hypothetical protein
MHRPAQAAIDERRREKTFLFDGYDRHLVAESGPLVRKKQRTVRSASGIRRKHVREHQNI